MPNFGWGYPPGVTGNEPQLTGIWPCDTCGVGCTDEEVDIDLNESTEGGWFCERNGCAAEERERLAALLEDEDPTCRCGHRSSEHEDEEDRCTHAACGCLMFRSKEDR